MSTNQNTPGRDAEGPAFGHAFRSESVAREMRSCQVNRLAIDGLPRVRGRRPAPIPDAAVLARAITDYSDGVRLAVEQGRRMAVMLRCDGFTVESIASHSGVSTFGVLLSVVLWDAHQRGQLLVPEGCEPMTRLQAAISAGACEPLEPHRWVGVFADLLRDERGGAR